MTGDSGTSGIVLAGGRSSRFGGSKLEADLGGTPLLAHAVASLGAVCDEVLVVGLAAGAEAPAPARAIPDPEPFGGPLVGLAAGLERATSDRVLVLAGDMPLAQPRLLRLLADRLRRSSGGAAPFPVDPADAVALVDRGRPLPLPLALRRDRALAEARHGLAAGDRSLRGLLDRLQVDLIDEATWLPLDPAGSSLLDVDTPADLDEARIRLDEGQG